VAVGQIFFPDSHSEGVVVPITNGTPGVARLAPATAGFNAIACASASTCQTLGYTVTAGQTASVVVAITDGTPGSPLVIKGVRLGLGIACAGAATCEVVGFGPTGVVVPIVNGTPGTAHELPGGTTGLDRIACPTAFTCQAVGDTGSYPDGTGVTVTVNVGPGSTLVCAPGPPGPRQPVMRCTATAPAGLQSIRVTDTTAGHTVAVSAHQACGSGASGTIEFPTFENDRYKVVVADCERPSAQDVYQVRRDGAATLTRAQG